jgi:hypothetical protein
MGGSIMQGRLVSVVLSGYVFQLCLPSGGNVSGDILGPLFWLRLPLSNGVRCIRAA